MIVALRETMRNKPPIDATYYQELAKDMKYERYRMKQRTLHEIDNDLQMILEDIHRLVERLVKEANKRSERVKL